HHHCFFQVCCSLRHLYSFPTRRSSDLKILRTIKYTSAIFHPKSTQSMKIITGFINGEAMRKLIEGPNGTFEFNNPASIGIVEQVQKDVTAPKNVPSILFTALFGRFKNRLIFSSDTTC